MTTIKIDYRARCRKIREDIGEYSSLQDYAKKNYLSDDAVRYQLSRHKLIGYKISGIWYVKPNVSS